MRRYMFADEAGFFNFSKNQFASKYFILCTISCDSCDMGTSLLSLRRELAWEGKVHDSFHATTDEQATRDQVYALINKYKFRIDATIFEKSKAMPKIRPSEERFYNYAWFLHFKHIGPKIVGKDDELFIAAASLGTKAKKKLFLRMLHDVAQQSIPGDKYQAVFWPATSDPCLQIADYCTWAIQRKWEKNDPRSYDLIRDKIASEFNIFGLSKTHYY